MSHFCIIVDSEFKVFSDTTLILTVKNDLKFDVYQWAELRLEFCPRQYTESRLPSFLAYHIDSYRMDIQVDIFPKRQVQY